MARQNINVGTDPNDGTGESIRSAWVKANANFSELYLNVASLSEDVDTVDYNDLSNLPTLGTASSLNTGTSEGEIPVLGVDGKLVFSTLPTGDTNSTVAVGDHTHSEFESLGDAAYLNVGEDIQPFNTDYLLSDVDATLSAGFDALDKDVGTITDGTVALTTVGGNFQALVNNGAFTLAAPSSSCSILLHITNGASAGAISLSGFTKVQGDVATTVEGDEFHYNIQRCGGAVVLTRTAI